MIPVSTTNGNSSPFAPCIVMILTASSSPSGTGTSLTRDPSSACTCIQSRNERSELPPDSAKARACSTMKRYLLHCSLVRGCSRAASIRSRSLMNPSVRAAGEEIIRLL